MLTPISLMNACCKFAGTSEKKVRTWQSQLLTLSLSAILLGSSEAVTQVRQEALTVASTLEVVDDMAMLRSALI